MKQFFSFMFVETQKILQKQTKRHIFVHYIERYQSKNCLLKALRTVAPKC